MDSESATARGRPRHAAAALDGITGAHIDWADSKCLNEWERKAWSWPKSEANSQLRDEARSVFRQSNQHEDQLRHHLGMNGMELAASLLSSLAWPYVFGSPVVG